MLSRFNISAGGSILGAMFNPVYSHFLFVSNINGIMYGFILNSNKTFTASISHNWGVNTWRGDVRWNFKGDICLFLAQDKIGAIRFNNSTTSITQNV